MRQAAVKIFREEGVLAFWKGNGVNIVRIFPYAAAQLSTNDFYKRLLADDSGSLTIPRRLLSGACAGMTATALTHPLDTLRLRLALPTHQYSGAPSGARRARTPLHTAPWLAAAAAILTYADILIRNLFKP